MNNKRLIDIVKINQVPVQTSVGGLVGGGQKEKKNKEKDKR